MNTFDGASFFLGIISTIGFLIILAAAYSAGHGNGKKEGKKKEDNRA